jgi:hypothetical protein
MEMMEFREEWLEQDELLIDELETGGDATEM